MMHRLAAVAVIAIVALGCERRDPGEPQPDPPSAGNAIDTDAAGAAEAVDADAAPSQVDPAPPPNPPSVDTPDTTTLAPDGYPTGHGSPEGAAADLARAFTARDSALFESTCIPPFGGGEALAEYKNFRLQTVAGIQSAALRTIGEGEPESIGAVFAARHMTMGGPASAGFSMFGFMDVMFVDVGFNLRGGGGYLQRTLMLQTSDGLWYAHPFPESAPLLSMGLNTESDSTIEIAVEEP